MPVYAAAVGFTDTDRVIEQALEAERVGVDAVQIHPPRPGPVAIRPRPDELERFYADVLSAVRGPVHLTNQVVMSGYALPVELMIHLVTTYDNVCALNTSDPNAGARARRSSSSSLRMSTSTWASSLSCSPPWRSVARARSCFEADVAPALCNDVVRCFRAGDVDGLQTAFTRLIRLNAVLSKFQNPRSVKAAMRQLGLPAGELRRPYLDLSSSEVDEIARTLRDLGLSS